MGEEIDWPALFAAAAAVQARAYAPYSRFPVGAAVLTADGGVFAGCNVENSSYGLTVCAERHAVAAAIAAGQPSIRAVAIVAPSQTPCPPCGVCRQVLAEFASPSSPVRFRSPSGAEEQLTVGELLPLAFTKKYL